jgi:hypothetical protein
LQENKQILQKKKERKGRKEEEKNYIQAFCVLCSVNLQKFAPFWFVFSKKGEG